MVAMGITLDKPHRIVSPKALETIRAIGHCEVCGKYGRPQAHHLTSRGAGGGDVMENLVAACLQCHDKIHRGLISRDELRAIIARR